jgi:hypothetical protein
MFLKLTAWRRSTGNVAGPVFVNIQHVWGVSVTAGRPVLLMADGHQEFVADDAETVVQGVRTFLKVTEHYKEHGEELYVNPDFLWRIEEWGEGAVLHVLGGDRLRISESPATILETMRQRID